VRARHARGVRRFYRNPATLSNNRIAITIGGHVPRSRTSARRTTPPVPAGLLTVGQTARILGVSASTLRLWENVGLVAPTRSPGRFRLYSRDHLCVLKRIKYLRDVQRLNVHGIKRELQGRAPQNGNGSRVPARESASEPIGPALRRLRERRGLSLGRAAEKAHISTGFLSQIERCEANPSVATLQKLAAGYDTTLMALFGGRSRHRRLVRPSQRRRVNAVPGVRMEFLSSGTRLLESMLFRVAPQAGSVGSYAHEGEEFILMLSGSLEIWLDELQCHVLREGDSFWFESTQAHRWSNPGTTEAVLLWINTPPTF
jgi:DNA-binding transcriptional MerR regulator/quercetin dioxygenase-like cupin family protein